MNKTLIDIIDYLNAVYKFSGYDGVSLKWYYRGRPVKDQQEYERYKKLGAFE